MTAQWFTPIYRRRFAGAANCLAALQKVKMAGALPPVDDLMHDAAQVPKEVEHAIAHERAMAQFYRVLSKQSVIPRLKETFDALAVAEENHAQRLVALSRPT